MAKFFVGQRVRIIGTVNPTMVIHVGKSGQIISGSRAFDAHWCVDDLKATNGKRAVWAEHHLEPILPEGAAPSIYSYQELMDKLREGERV
jgi:hypothetical protein